MSDNEQSRAAGARLSIEQYEVLMKHLEQIGEKRSEYVRRLIAEDMKAHGIQWPEYAFIPNDERAPDKKGMPWISGKKSKTDN